jgi:putative membrane protein insertion efficiency factor
MMKRLLLALINVYRKVLSPLKRYPTCRFRPTCSEYAYEAVDRYGAIKGGILAIKRILRCHPWGKSGYDPVP